MSISLGSPSFSILLNLMVIFITFFVTVGDPGNLLQKCEDIHDGTLLNFVQLFLGEERNRYYILCRPYIKGTLSICDLKWNVVPCFFFTCAVQKYASILSEFISKK